MAKKVKTDNKFVTDEAKKMGHAGFNRVDISDFKVSLYWHRVKLGVPVRLNRKRSEKRRLFNMEQNGANLPTIRKI